MKTALLICLLSLPFLAKAQFITQREIPTINSKPFARKTWQIGIQGGYSPAELVGKNVTLAGYGGYFITDKLLLGLSGTSVREWSPDFFTVNTYTAGPIVRYQFTRTRISPFVAASYQIGTNHLSAGNDGNLSTTYTVTPSGSTIITITDPNKKVGIQSPDGYPTVFSRSFTAGLSIGLVPKLRVDVALNWRDVVSPSQPALNYRNGFLQPQFGVNYALGKTRLNATN